MEYFNEREKNMEKAKAHTALMEEKYGDSIKECIRKSEILEGNRNIPLPIYPVTDLKNVYIIPMRSEEAVIQEYNHWGEKSQDTPAKISEKYGRKIAVLNFSSYKNPGGMFMRGSIAQEESLCHASFLYNVLDGMRDTFYDKSKTTLNKSLYTDRGIYSPNVYFPYHDDIFKDLHWAIADVYTIAAPNAGAATRNGVPPKDIYDELNRRIRFVIQSMLDHGPYISVILGAYGCGVFKNNPYDVANLFYAALDNKECRDNFYRVVFAIIGDNNITPFQQRLDGRRKSFDAKDTPVTMDVCREFRKYDF